MLRKKDKIAVSIIVIVVACITIFYTKFVSNIIFKESRNHLHELYAQINIDIQELAHNNWKLLRDWGIYIDQFIDKNDEESLKKYIIAKQEEWDFTDFYFLEESGRYKTISGKEGYLELGIQLEDLMVKKENISIGNTCVKGCELVLFAVPVKQDEYDGMKYSAIAVSYNSSDINNVTDVSAFSDKAECYVTYLDGRIVMSNMQKKNRFNNYLARLEEKVHFKKGEFEKIVKDIENGREGTKQYRLNGEEYYLIYMPVKFQKYVLIGSVPQEVVNESMSILQWSTAIMVSGILFIIALGIAIYYRQINKKKIKDMDVEIQYREQLFSLLEDSSTYIYGMLSATDFKTEYISPNIERLLGIPVVDVMLGIDALKKSHVDKINIDWEDMKQLKSGECIQTERRRVNISTGEYRWYKEKLYRVSIEGHSKFLLVMTDCTEDKNLRFQLEQALHIAKVANKAKSNFLSNMSHDIRTPMNAIIGFAQLIEKNISDGDKVKNYIRKISNASKHLLGLINDILDMSKIESGNTTINIEEFSVEDIAEEIDDMVQPLVRAKKQQFNIELININGEKYKGDTVKIKQILINLLSNAVKYTGECGNISFTIYKYEQKDKKKSKFHFIVKDDGIGMNKDYIKEIFKPFSRETNSRLNNQQGTGLGMTITRGLVDLMGGSISVKSEQGEGSTFTVDLEFVNVEMKENDVKDFGEGTIEEDINEIINNVPNCDRDNLDNADVILDDKTEDEIKLSDMRFLIAEDNEINAEIIKELLAIENIECDLAVNGQEVVEMFEDSKEGYYQVILMDVQMPIMLGTEVSKIIRQSSHPQAKSIKIIAMTANAFEEDIERSLNSGMDAHLSKPVDIETVKNTVISLFSGRKYCLKRIID